MATRRVRRRFRFGRFAAFLLGPQATFITGSDLLIDGGVIAALRGGKVSLGRDLSVDDSAAS